MRYQGGKTKQRKYILPIIEGYLRGKNVWYIEPFVGGGSIFTCVDHPLKLGADIDSDVIDLWKHCLINHSPLPDPNDITEELYTRLKKESDLPNSERKFHSWIHGLVSHACSYGGKKWGGYARFNPKKGENHIAEAINGLRKQISEFKKPEKLMLLSCPYYEVPVVPKSVIYCDPPYMGTLGYGNEFDHDRFWNWCRLMVAEFDCTVLVSEYNAPKDFRCVLSINKKDGMGTTKEGNKQKNKTEKLFVANGNI